VLYRRKELKKNNDNPVFGSWSTCKHINDILNDTLNDDMMVGYFKIWIYLVLTKVINPTCNHESFIKT
jgi:hypothetical protein